MEILEAYNAKVAKTVWTENPNNKIAYLGAGTLFPFTWQDTLDMAFAKGSRGLPTSLKASDYDAKATFRDRIALAKLETDMPYFKEGFILKASDIIKIKNAQNHNDVFLNDALKNIFRDNLELIEGAYVVPERMCFQLLAPVDGTPKIIIGDNKNTYTYNYDPRGNWKAKNFLELTGTDMWSDVENSKPYDDIEKMLETISDNGHSCSRLLMKKGLLNRLIKNKDIHARILAQNSTANIYLTKKLIKDFIEQEFSIKIITYDKKYKDETGATKSFMPDDFITFLPDTVLGETRFAPTPEQLEQQADSLQMIDGRIALSVIKGTGNPVSIETIASMTVLPSYENMDSVYGMKVA